MIPRDYVISVDEALIIQDVPLHSRPMGVLARWMSHRGLSGNVLDERYYAPLMAVYSDLYPEGDFGTPPMLEGGVGFRDQVFLAHANLGFGEFSVDPIDCIRIPYKALLQMHRNYPDQFWHSYYVVADIWDFAYVINHIGGNDETAGLLRNAAGHITAAARALQASGDAAAAVQSACLVAELAMKGVLAHRGMVEADRRRLSHRLSDLVEEIIAIAPNANDEYLRASVQAFPDYIDCRYQHHGMNKIELIKLMHSSQFVAAEAVRRVTDRNLAAQIAASADVPARKNW